jgi:hypothetical protein
MELTRTLTLLLLLTLSASAQTPRIPPPESVNRNGLVGRWLVPGYQTGNGLKPTKVNDNSGKGNHLTTYNSPNYGVIYSRAAMQFNGFSQYIGGTLASSISNKWTFSLWVWTANAEGQQINYPIATSISGSNSVMIYVGGVYSDAVVYKNIGFLHNGLWTSSVANSFTTPDFSKWVHIVCTFDDTASAKSAIYKNSEQLALMYDRASGSRNIDTINIGRRWEGVWYWFGYIADVRLYSRALAPSEVSAIYQGLQ